MSRRTSAAAARRDLRNELPAIAALCDENVLFYLRLSELAAKIHRQGPLSGPRRTILAGLARSGPRTVAHMARDRGQARQRIQPVVNSLIDDGLLQAAPNTANRKSPLIVVTARGHKEVARIQRVERQWRLRIKVRPSHAAVNDAIDVLRTVRLEIERLLRDE
jgi:DNA-binding MarR family transcriptional regulator